MITDSFEIFCDKYHKRQHLSDDLIKYIMNMNTKTIHLEKLKKEHKEKLISSEYGLNKLCRRLNIDQQDYYGTIVEQFQRLRNNEKRWYKDSLYLQDIYPIYKGYFV